MTHEHFKYFADGMSAITEMTPAALRALEDVARYISLEKDQFFLKAGTPATLVGYIVSGAAREFFVTESGREYNKAFFFEGDFTGSIHDLRSQQAAEVSIECLAPTHLVAFDFCQLEALAAEHACIATTLHWAVERLFHEKLRREQELLAMNGLQRYQALLRQHPQIERRVPQFHIASYLGVTPVSLSRFKRTQSR